MSLYVGKSAQSARGNPSIREAKEEPKQSPEEGKRQIPKDGGWKAWLQVSAAFALYWNSLGLVNGFGAFQTYYQQSLLSNESASAISWIGSVQVFFLMAGGVILGPLYDLGHLRSMLIAGAFLVLLAQGFCVGIGTSCLYMPAITLIPAYFTTRRALAMGIATVGSSLGAATYPLVFERLQPRIGFGWTVRIIGFISLVMSCYAVIVARPRLKAKPTGLSLMTSPKKIAEVAGLLETRYMIQCVAIFFSNVAFFEPLYYLQTFANSHGMQGQSLAKYLLVILNVVAIPGRIIPSLVADRVGVLPTYICICTLTAVSVFYWISVGNRAGNIAFTVLYGFFSGSVVTLAPVVLTSITDNLSVLGTRLGFVAVLKGIGSLIGPPIAGAILGNTGSYLGVQLFTGLAFALTAFFAAQLSIVITRRKARLEKEHDGPSSEQEEKA